MARTIKEQEYAGKRNDILDSALRLVYTKGYERMTIQDIQADLGISSGAFYHYFDSKPALLEALVERSAKSAMENLQISLQNPRLTALQKFQAYFEASAQWKSTQKSLILSLLYMWYKDENAVIRQKMTEAAMKYTPALLELIIRQGIEEKIFNTLYPKQVAVMIMSITLSFGNSIIDLMLSPHPDLSGYQKTETLFAAYFDTIERILGAPVGSLKTFDADMFKDWFVEIQPETES